MLPATGKSGYYLYLDKIIMLPVSDFHYPNYKKAALISLLLAALLLVTTFIVGNHKFFLSLNADWGKAGDLFFKYWTYTGDGVLWTAAIIFLWAKRKWYLLPFFISAVVFNTLLVQVCKKLILHGMLRPYAAIGEKELIHVVEGVKLHSMNSFPSGHTATAFALALIICLLSRQRYWLLLSLTAALLAGYSRIYLAQHFPMDVGAGIIAAVIAVGAAILVQQKFQQMREKRPL